MSGIVVCPVRFTEQIKAMQAFLETLGLRPRIESEGGSWVDMVAGGGMVGLHTVETAATGAVQGETGLSFEADDVGELAARLTSAGVEDVVVYDEAYGRVLSCRDPLGDVVLVNERSEDLYGYRLHGGQPVSDLRVVPVRFTDPRGPFGGWLETLGLSLVGEADDSYVMFAAGEGDHGYVGVHRVYADELPIVARPNAVQLTFSTSESLDDVASRLVDAGHADATVLREDFGSLLSVTDPDGQECQVHTLDSSG